MLITLFEGNRVETFNSLAARLEARQIRHYRHTRLAIIDPSSLFHAAGLIIKVFTSHVSESVLANPLRTLALGMNAEWLSLVSVFSRPTAI